MKITYYGHSCFSVVAGLVDVVKVIGVHYDTFDFIKIDKAETRLAFEKAGLKLHLPEIGQIIDQ